MQLSKDIKIYPFPETPGYLLLFSEKRGILFLVHESFYISMKNGNISAFDRYCLLMNEVILEDQSKHFHDVLVLEFPGIDIKQELEQVKQREEQLFHDEYPAPDLGVLVERINVVIKDFFPDRFKPTISPSREKIISSYRNMDRVVKAYIYGKRPGTKEAFVKEAYYAIAAIRQIDDFIDKYLWPNLSSYHPQELSELFYAFLNRWLATVKEFDPEMPDEIIELCLIEMDLALNSSQENFEKKFEQLFKRKSLDIFYIYQRIHNCVTKSIPSNFLYKLALIDYIRDFYKESIETDTDLSLYKYIHDNKIDPGKLVDFLIRFYQREDPVGSMMTKSYIADQKKPIIIERQKKGIPVYEPFHKVFTRAITLLQKLENKSH